MDVSVHCLPLFSVRDDSMWIRLQQLWFFLRKFVPFQLFPAAYTYFVNAHLEVKKEPSSSCQVIGIILESFIPKNCLSAASNYTFLHAIWFSLGFFSPPRPTPKNILVFSFHFLTLQCLLLTLFRYPVAQDLDRGISLVELLLGLQLAVGGEHCETSSFSHGYKGRPEFPRPQRPYQLLYRAHISSEPYYQIILPFSWLLLLKEKCSGTSHHGF